MLYTPAEPLMILAEVLSFTEPIEIVSEELNCRDYHERGFDVSEELRLK